LRLRTHLYRLSFFTLLSYGFLYFSYKWLNPTRVNVDFIEYYGMIQHPFDFHAAPSPWVYRQWTAVIAHALWKLHVYYPDVIQFYDPRYGQRIFFAALLTNFLSVVVAAWLTTLIIDHWLASSSTRQSTILPLFAGMLCFFSFYLQETTITGQADGLSWAIVALCYVLYQRHSLLVLAAVLLLSILQREIIPVIFLVFACTDLLAHRKADADARRFLSWTAVASAAAFAAYLLTRHFIAAPGNEYQADLHAQLRQLLAFRPTSAYFAQVFFGQNLLAILAGLSLLAYKRHRTLSNMLLPLAAACIALLLISVMTQIGTNASRMLALLTPIVAAEITIALIQLEEGKPTDMLARDAGS
jgi:hypothetical protein